jgi:CMP-N,N'-diacetyllegionaminic acid synthase
MSKKIACIVGYGSIGILHYKILNKLKYFDKIYICTKQNLNKKHIIHSIEEIPNLNPDYIVLCSPTINHYKQLLYLNSRLKNKTILVEKPLFYKNINFPLLKNKIYVGYDMRFNPLMEKIKSLIKNKKIWSINIFCGSFLPDWRKNIHYTQSYSAFKKLGGGVAFDLSHELDYVSWIFGDITPKFVISNKVSNLKITSNDLFILIGKIKNIYLNLTLNYYTKKSTRNLLIDGENISIEADFINNKLFYNYNNKNYNFNINKSKRGNTTNLLHKSIIFNKGKRVSTFKDGLKIIKLINKSLIAK